MSFITLICLNNAFTSDKNNIGLNCSNDILLCNFITEFTDIAKCLGS